MTTKKDRRNLGLTEGQLNILETFHRRNLRFLLYQLDDSFCIQPIQEGPWHNLGYYLIEVLKASDKKAFEMICQGILHSMLKGEELADPYSAAAIATTHFTDNKLFRQILEMLRSKIDKDGVVSFGSEILGKGDNYSTLFVLNILHIADRAKDHMSIVEPALNYLEKNADEIINESPVFAARFMMVELNLNPDNGKKIAEKCLKSILDRRKENKRWDDTPLGLGADGEIVTALIDAALVLGTEAGKAAEEWLEQVFDLDLRGDLPEWPNAFVECKNRTDRPDLWIEAWLKATLAATRYLTHQRPDHNVAAYLLGLSVPQENILVRAEQLITMASPYLPPMEELKIKAQHLVEFWNTFSSPYEKTVYIMYDANESDERKAIVTAVTDTLKTHGLTGRHVAEGSMPYLMDPWDNAGLYMTGCKYGVALFDRLHDKTGDAGAKDAIAPELMYQVGFMRGQGMKLLTLWDKKTIGSGSVAIPGVEVPMNNVLPCAFDSSEQGLVEMVKGIEEWISSLEQ